MEANLSLLDQYLIPGFINVALALTIFLVGKIASDYLTAFVTRLMLRSRLDEMLVKFLRNLLYVLLLVAVALAAVTTLGVNVTSLLAILGAAGLAVGLALKDSLSNSAVIGSTITNSSALPTRRIDQTFQLAYTTNIGDAKKTIESVVSANMRVLKDPMASMGVDQLGNNTITLFVRSWVLGADYTSTRADLLEKIKNALDAAGISFLPPPPAPPPPARNVIEQPVKTP